MTMPSLADAEARRRAVADLDTTFLVEAGAGTGKTRVLLQRLLALVRSGRSPLERIAAITFTEKAAAELRVRLHTEIEAALSGSLSATERRNLREARGQVERAPISTVHGFCRDLLGERPIEARVEPTFSVLDSFGARIVQRDLWREWLAREMDRGPDILRQALRSEVTLAHLEALRDFVLEHRECLPLLPPAVESPPAELQTLLLKTLPRLTHLAAACRNAQDRALLEIKTLTELMALEGERWWERLLSDNFLPHAKAGTKANWQSATALDEVRDLLRQIAHALLQARSAWGHNLSLGLAAWLKDYLRRYEQRKRERGSLDFVDLLLVTRDLLRDNTDVRQYFQRKFSFLLVDEFQDTDPLQAEIIFFLAEREPRAREWTQASLRPGKLFLVGDPQQSIYRFRRADLAVYAQVRAAILQQGEVLSLAANFRTRAPALAWINETFTREFAGATEDQPPYQPLVETRHENSGHEVILLPVVMTSEAPNREEMRQTEARAVVEFLTQTVGDIGVETWGGRAIGYGDVAVLCRTYQAIQTYEDALRDAGVPYRIVGGHRYAQRQEVEEIRALLRGLERPSDATALVAILRSSLFGFSDEDLAAFVSAGGRLDYTQRPSLPGPRAERFTAAFSLLREWHGRRVQLSPAALLSEIYAHTHLLPLFAVRPQGAQRVTNLLKLIDTARTLAAQGLPTLTALNRFLDDQEAMAEEAEPVVIEDHDPAVRLLTIHQAKGLEFPVVILADAAYSQRWSPRIGIADRVDGTLELRIGSRALTCTTLGWQKAEAREQERDAAEERRLRYVAATRARDHLVIPLVLPSDGKAKTEHWAVTEELSLLLNDALSGTLKEGTLDSARVEQQRFTYYLRKSQKITSPMPSLPLTPIFSRVEPDLPSLRRYHEWEARRRAVVAAGRQGAPIWGVTTLAATEGSEEFSLPRNEATGVRLQLQQTSLRLGKAVHMALRGASNPQVIINAQTKGLWTAAQREDATRLLQQVLASPVAARARIAPERFAEEPFVLHYQGCLLEGMIDLAFSEKEAWVLVDFKTAQVRETEVTAQAAVYRPQLYLCALALERLTGRPVAEILLLFVRTQQEVRWTWGERERTETEEFVMKISKGKDKVEDHP